MNLRRLTQAVVLGTFFTVPWTVWGQATPLGANNVLAPTPGREGGGVPADVKEASKSVKNISAAQVLFDFAGGRNQPAVDTLREAPVTIQVQHAIQRLNAAKSKDEKAAAKQALKDALGAQFTVDMNRRSAELNAIKQRVAKMEAMLQKRMEKNSEIIMLRLQTLVNNAEGLGWSEGPGILNGTLFPPSDLDPTRVGFSLEQRAVPRSAYQSRPPLPALEGRPIATSSQPSNQSLWPKPGRNFREDIEPRASHNFSNAMKPGRNLQQHNQRALTILPPSPRVVVEAVDFIGPQKRSPATADKVEEAAE